MDCRTASLLIEAYHDDELELVDAAHLLAHLEECPECRERCEEAGKLRETLKTCRPVDRCPEELARRLARHLDVRAKRRRTFPRSVTIVFAAGCGIAVGWAAVRFRTPAVHGLALASAVQASRVNRPGAMRGELSSRVSRCAVASPPLTWSPMARWP